MPLPTGFGGDVTTLARRWVPQATRELPAALASGRDFASVGSPWALTSQLIDPLAFAPSGAPPRQVLGKDALAANVAMGSLDPNNHGLILALANLLRRYDLSTPSAGVTQWLMGLSRGTGMAQFLTAFEDNDTTPRARLIDHLVTGATISAGSGDALSLSLDALAGWVDFHGDATQTTGAGSTLPEIRGDWGKSHSGGIPDDEDLILTVSADNGDGTFEILAVVGTGAAPGAVTNTVTPGQWTRIYDSNGNPIGGEPARQPWIYFATPATLVATDVFRVPAKRAAWATTLLPERRIGSSQTIVSVGGVESKAEGGATFTITRAGSTQQAWLGGSQGFTTKQQGPLAATASITSEIVDWTTQELMALASSGTKVPVVLDARHASVIGASVITSKIQVVLPSCTVSGQLFSPGDNSIETTENPTFTAAEPDAPYVYDGVSYSDHVGIRIVTEISGL